jgi:hypothetical protein
MVAAVTYKQPGQFNISATLSAPGYLYYAVVIRGARAPNVTEVVQGALLDGKSQCSAALHKRCAGCSINARSVCCAVRTYVLWARGGPRCVVANPHAVRLCTSAVLVALSMRGVCDVLCMCCGTEVVQGALSPIHMQCGSAYADVLCRMQAALLNVYGGPKLTVDHC